MIKLTRAACPVFLTTEKVHELTEIFKSSKKSVWNILEIKEPLCQSSKEKCAYCECQINSESSYMEVEHFQHKDQYPNKVVDWENLLPSCKRCNGTKSTHDTVVSPIVNPYTDNPADHFWMDVYFLKPKTKLGEESIEVLDLNNTKKVTKKRFDIGSGVITSLQNAHEKLDIYKANQSTRSKNRLISHVKGLLEECIPQALYSATAATILHSQDDYHRIKQELSTLTLWDDEMEEMHQKSYEIIFT